MNDVARLPGSRAHDVTGQRFGLLTAREPIGVLRAGAGMRWLLDCECGWQAIRTLGYLRQAVKRGAESMCARCAKELQRGLALGRRQRRWEAFVASWEESGSLWSPDSVDHLCAAVRADLERELGPTHRLEVPEPTGELADGTPREARHWCGGCGCPETITRAGLWRCEGCKATVRKIQGCLRCARVECTRCRGGAVLDGRRSLESVAIELGCTAERVRQIEASAMLKLRKRAHFSTGAVADLGDFFEGKRGVFPEAPKQRLTDSASWVPHENQFEKARNYAPLAVGKPVSVVVLKLDDFHCWEKRMWDGRTWVAFGRRTGTTFQRFPLRPGIVLARVDARSWVVMGFSRVHDSGRASALDWRVVDGCLELELAGWVKFPSDGLRLPSECATTGTPAGRSEPAPAYTEP